MRHDGEIDAGDPGAECQKAEHKRQNARHQQDQQQRHREMADALPEPGQLAPVEKHHEIRKLGIAIDAPIANLAHQVHAHHIAAQCKEGGMSQAQDPQIAPHQIQRHRQQGVTEIFTQQGDGIAAHIQDAALRQQQVGCRSQQHTQPDQGQQQHAPLIL